MSKKANPKLIGAFVIGGFALAVGAVAVFATGRFFEDTKQWVVFFDQSVKGLQVGAPVAFRGVQLGAVSGIVVEYNAETSDIRVPVIFEIYPDRLSVVGATTRSDEDSTRALIEHGLRVQLQSQSLVTGQQFIQMDFFPDDPPQYRAGDHPLPEFPSVPSAIAQIEETFQTAAEMAPELLTEATEFLASAGELLDDKNKESISNILDNVERFSVALAEGDGEIGEILDETTALLGNLQDTSAELELIVKNVHENRDTITNAVEQIAAAGAAVTRMSDQVNNLIAETRPGIRDFSNEGLYEFTGLAQDGQDLFEQISRVADELERDPARFLFGDRQQGVNTE